MSGASTFDANPGCSGSFTATPFGSNGMDTNTPSMSIQQYKDLQYNDGKGLIQNAQLTPNRYNSETKQWTDAEGYITAIKTSAGPDATAHYLFADSTTINGSSVQEQSTKDAEFMTRAKAEYCFLRMYYKGFLEAFLTTVSGNDDTQASNYLGILIELNKKINAFVSLVDYIANKRAAYIDLRSSLFQTENENLMANFEPIAAATANLDAQKSILDTRKEMIRYTKEKNNSITNHISLWAALNVVAIAMIFTLYRKM